MQELGVQFPERWGPLAARYSVSGPRKMLALDGGGVRGIITLSFLKRLETLLNARLCDYFDYIAGTSTGAIIAACLARGMTVDEVINFYLHVGPEMFEKSRLDRRLASIYRSDPLEAHLRTTFAHEDGRDRTLTPEHLNCLLMVVTRNVTTDTPWPISSNPDATYNDPARPDCNLKVPLWKIVRASTAAPIYFPPEIVHWDESDPTRTFTFVDGGVTPHNNPAFLLYRMATHPAYQLEWPKGEKNLLLVSIGTGASRHPHAKYHPNLFGNLLGLPAAIMHSVQIEQDINCRCVGRCSYGDYIDRELHDMTDSDTDSNRAFLYVRYNADLSHEGPEVLKIDAVDQIPNLIRIGNAAAVSQVDLKHLGSFAP